MDKIDQIIADHTLDIFKKMDELIKSKLREKGFDPDDVEFMKTRVTLITQEVTGKREFYVDYGKESEVRIITILPVEPLLNDSLTHYSTVFKYY